MPPMPTEPTIRCPNCGKRLALKGHEDNRVFCTACGKTFAAPQLPATLLTYKPAVDENAVDPALASFEPRSQLGRPPVRASVSMVPFLVAGALAVAIAVFAIAFTVGRSAPDSASPLPELPTTLPTASPNPSPNPAPTPRLSTSQPRDR